MPAKSRAVTVLKSGLLLAFHAGRAADPETLAMNLLLGILIDGDSSRLHRVLVEEEQLAIAIGGFQFEGFDPGLVYFYATLPPGGDLALLEARIIAELERVAAEGVGEDELAKARNMALADYWRSMATISGKAAGLGEMTALGIPVPPGFTITTEVGREYRTSGSLPDGLQEAVVASARFLVPPSREAVPSVRPKRPIAGSARPV